MHDIIVNVETAIPFQALDRRNGDYKTGALISIRRRANGEWWDDTIPGWAGTIAYNEMTHISRGSHEYLMTFPAVGEYQLMFSHEDNYMINDSYVITVYPEERVVESDFIQTLRGAGANEGTVTILEGADNPVADADIWISTDSAGTNVVAGTLQTNSQGKVTFWLDTGVTYYVWGQKDGKNFDNPQEVVW